jgi:hypothetical protein
MKDTASNSTKQLKQSTARLLAHYAVPLFVVVVAAVYAFLLLRVHMLNNVQPDPVTLSSSTKTLAVPRIDSATVKKIQELQDNNVNVQSLFNQARQNPFQE